MRFDGVRRDCWQGDRFRPLPHPFLFCGDGFVVEKILRSVGNRKFKWDIDRIAADSDRFI